MSDPDNFITELGQSLKDEQNAVWKEQERLDRLIARHQKKRDDLKRPTTRTFLEALFTSVTASIPESSFEIAGPFGLGAEYGVTINIAGYFGTHISFRSSDTPMPLLVDPKSDDGSFAKGTLGRVNGLHKKASELPSSLCKFIDYVTALIAEERLRKMAGQ